MSHKLLITIFGIIILLIILFPFVKKDIVALRHHQVTTPKPYTPTNTTNPTSTTATATTPAAAAPAIQPVATGPSTPTNTSSYPLSNGTTATVTTYSYGTSSTASLDVYTTPGMHNAPIIFMVHGGGATKSSPNVVENKVNYWMPKGYMFISIEYPMTSTYSATVREAAVTSALQYVQAHATEWQGDAGNMVLMGHSVGAMILSMISDQQDQLGLSPWRGTVLLDSDGYDLVAKMQSNPPSYYKETFGTDTNVWVANSPLVQLTKAHEPLYMVCSSGRADDCNQATEYANKAIGFGGTATVYPIALKHEEIETNLGLPSAYTTAVDTFIAQVTGK